MEFFEGQTATSHFNKTISDVEAIELMISAAMILGDIHRSGLVHRDINLENILIGNNNQIKIIDFGLTAEIGLDATNHGDDVIVGSFQFASPEQLKTISKSVDGRSDLYSLGVIFHRLLTGSFPFEGEKLEEVIESQKTKKPKLVHEIRQGSSVQLSRIIHKLLSIDPIKRYQTSSGLIFDLRKLSKDRLTSTTETLWDIGSNDIINQNQSNSPLIGRENEKG